jgi:hypothetical protein
VLPLEFKPAYSVGDLLTQHLDELEEEAERKGGILQALTDHFTKIYNVALFAASPVKAHPQGGPYPAALSPMVSRISPPLFRQA